eukprot:GILJ01002191.1.p1 GENE.GILJ01002191.1~~GILJ01002191.1.p1  ORF type:complete len:411 (-),score=78.87 GILJ01002191.1:136-1368(-)
MGTFITQESSSFFDEEFLQMMGGTKEEMELLLASIAPTSQSTLLLKKEKEAREVEQQLERIREEVNRRMHLCELRQKEFEAKQQEMREQVAKFERFILENDLKRQRAEQRLRGEMEASKKKSQEIQELRDRLDDLRNQQMKQESMLDRYRVYSRYLEQTATTAEEEFQGDIETLVNRYNTLAEGNRELRTSVDGASAAADDIRQNLINLQKETQNEILVNNATIHRHQMQIEKIQNQSAIIESQLETRIASSKLRTADVGQVQMSIKNLFSRVVSCNKGRLPPRISISEKENPVQYLGECLKVVAERVSELIAMERNYQIILKEKEAQAASKASPELKRRASRSSIVTDRDKSRDKSMSKNPNRSTSISEFSGPGSSLHIVSRQNLDSSGVSVAESDLHSSPSSPGPSTP